MPSERIYFKSKQSFGLYLLVIGHPRCNDVDLAMSFTGVCAAGVVPLHERHDACGAGWRDSMEEGQQNAYHQGYASVRARLRETPRTSTVQRYWPDALASAVPPLGQACRSMPAFGV